MTRVSLFLRAARHPADSDGMSNRWCPGTGQGTKGTMASVPLWASTALQSAVSLRELFSPKAIRHCFVVVEYYECDLAFDWSGCLVLSGILSSRPLVVEEVEVFLVFSPDRVIPFLRSRSSTIQFLFLVVVLVEPRTEFCCVS